MDNDGKRFAVGIDLGTTNCALSYSDLTEKRKKPQVKIFKVGQLSGPGEFSRLSVLPSFYYIPGKYDISMESIALPWKTSKDNFVGAFARDHGAKVPARLVSSAKSWLCHGNVDRRSGILPWGAGEEVYKVSPVEATAAYLAHLRSAWNAAHGDDEELFLENQLVVITVPASFDEVARDLTVEAAAMAGLKDITLLEEPLAAFYSWLIRHENDWVDHVNPNELILVCDVGGGTTDFTLISLSESAEGTPRFERIAVGDHLILGGDNIDFALARAVELQNRQNASLSNDRWKTLCHECRNAKEKLLAGISDSEKITLMGSGARLIAGTLSADLPRQQVEEIVLEGFFPLVDHTDFEKKTGTSGIAEFGLPFEQEPAITRHLGWFLEKHKEDVEKFLSKKPMPDLIMFNGGSLKPEIIQDRVKEAVRRWFGENDQTIPRVIENPDPDLAVSMGAAYYGLVKKGRGVRVGSGSPRAYYLGVAGKKEKEVQDNGRRAICVVERGLDEGTTIGLEGKDFQVLTNQPANFDIFSSSFRSGDKVGDIIDIDNSLTALPPVRTVIQFGKSGEKGVIPVKIEADYTEIGTLVLWCRSKASSHKWQLQFQLRSDHSASSVVPESEVYDESIIIQARKEIGESFAKGLDKGRLEGLGKRMAEIVDRTRGKWPLSFIRSLGDELLLNLEQRKNSAEHEARWLNLMGFTMRPGFGEMADGQRITKLWKLYQHGLQFPKNKQAALEWWILWRRVAGGFNPGQQRQFIQDLTPIILSKKGQTPKISVQVKIEIWMAVASMEKLLVKDKIKWGRKLLRELKPKKTKPQLFWALSRIGARDMLYGSSDRVIPREEAAAWIEKIINQEWKNPKPVGPALIHLARKTGDRIRDLDQAVVDKVLDWLAGYEYFKGKEACLKEVVPMARQEENTLFGEDLPSGLVL